MDRARRPDIVRRMRRWSRPLGIIATCILLGVVLALALRSGQPQHAPAADLRNGRVFIQDNLWSTPHRQYAVWVGRGGTPYVGSRRVEGGPWRAAGLANLPGNPLDAPTADDEHNVYVIATDARGNVHIAGNMHDAPLRYIRARAGHLHAWRPRPAPHGDSQITYPAFVGLPDGTLLFWRRIGVAGDGVIRLDALGPGDRQWTPLGAVVDGRPTGESPYLHHIAVDPRTGTIHIMFEWRAGEGIQTNSDVGYARSRDGGATWETSDGTPLRLPIRHSTAETVIDTQPTGSGLLNGGGLTVDARGRPHGVVAFNRPGTGNVVEHVWLEHGTWHREEFDDLFLSGRPQVVGTPDGRVWLLGASGADLEAIDISPDRERLPTRVLAKVPVGWEAAYDSQALARSGRLEMLIPDGSAPHVFTADLAAP
jgi:hypothetical protein